MFSASMLQEKPQSRPNIYQVVREVCLLRGTDVPIKDVSISALSLLYVTNRTQIYSDRTASEARRNQHLPSPPGNVASPSLVGAYKAAPVEEKPYVPDITPMRRGRPTDTVSKQPGPRPSPSPMRIINSDPFVALDSAPNAASDNNSLDEVSVRFPPLEKFSILHDSGNKFAFDQKSSASSATLPKDISQRVTEALADEAFAIPIKSTTEPLAQSKSIAAPGGSHSDLRASSGNLSIKAAKPQPIQQPAPDRPNMVSTGTMTSPSPPPSAKHISQQPSRAIFRFPPPTSDQRSSSQPRASDISKTVDKPTDRGGVLSHRPALLDHRSKSQLGALSVEKPSASSRPSLEGGRPVAVNYDESLLNRSRSMNLKSRPVSAHIEPKRRLLHGRSPSREPPLPDMPSSTLQDLEREPFDANENLDDGNEPSKIESNVEFLRAMEEEDPSRRKDRRSLSGSKHVKRASMPSISLSGTKSLLAGRFGEAFRRFETNTTSSIPRDTSPSPNRGGNDLTPIAGSEATDGRSDDGQVLEESEQTLPEVRRELERRRLSQEERRVADAAAAYKRRVAEKGSDSNKARSEGTRAALIQNKVQALLDENGKSSPTKTAEGYGRFTDHPRQVDATANDKNGISVPLPKSLLQTGHRTPVSAELPVRRNREPPPSTSSTPSIERPFIRPSAPPKPQALRTGGRGDGPVSMVPQQPRSAGRSAQHFEANNTEDWETDFSKRYPSLSGLEMVETEIDKKGSGGITIKDV